MCKCVRDFDFPSEVYIWPHGKPQRQNVKRNTGSHIRYTIRVSWKLNCPVRETLCALHTRIIIIIQYRVYLFSSPHTYTHKYTRDNNSVPSVCVCAEFRAASARDDFPYCYFFPILTLLSRHESGGRRTVRRLLSVRAVTISLLANLEIHVAYFSRAKVYIRLRKNADRTRYTHHHHLLLLLCTVFL